MTGSEWERARLDRSGHDPLRRNAHPYGQIATQLGDPTKARAARLGQCRQSDPRHRSLPPARSASAGNLTGFGGGIDAKIQLLIHEGAMLPGFA